MYRIQYVVADIFRKLRVYRWLDYRIRHADARMTSVLDGIFLLRIRYTADGVSSRIDGDRQDGDEFGYGVTNRRSRIQSSTKYSQDNMDSKEMTRAVLGIEEH